MSKQRCPHDGGTCHHHCEKKCWRKDHCGALTTPWDGFPVPGDAPVKDDSEEKPAKAWLVQRIKDRRDGVAPYGICPLCHAVDAYGTTRERSLDGYTRCGACDGRTKSIEWKQPKL